VTATKSRPDKHKIIPLTCAPFILSPLTYIFNKIISKGIFPERLKFSEIKPLYKKGNMSDFSNYRPISLLTSFSKIIEKLMYNRLYYYFDQHKLFAKEQHGFKQNASMETATFSLLNTIFSILEQKKKNCWRSIHRFTESL
jgi:hypothetical protein